ncbi:MAG: radical SAM protein [Kofleriaceae bacterium]
MALLDVILLYDCNLACDYCTITPAMRARSLATDAVLRELRAGRTAGFDEVSFTGGEPTVRPDLLGLVRAARALGYRRVKVQSNGLVLGQGDNAARLVAAGCDDLHVSIHTHAADAYDALVRRPDSHALMEAGVRAGVATGVTVTVDLIITASTMDRLADAVAWAAARGVAGVDLWFVSLTDGNRANLASMPRMTEAMPHVHAALAVGRARGLAMRSLHVPRCLLGRDVDHAFDPGAGRVRVVSPDAVFELAQSKLTGQHHVDACAGCRYRAVCPGLRADYLARFGDDEVVAARPAMAGNPTPPAPAQPP